MAGEEVLGKVHDGRVWDELCDALKRAGRAVIENAPDDLFERAEGLRYVSRIATHALVSFVEESDPAHPALSSRTPKLGGDNPDYVYHMATISGRHDYRLRGVRGDAQRIGIGAYHGGLGTPQGLQASGYRTDAELAFARDGSFELLLSVREQPGNWLPMRPETNQLMIRQTLLDRRRQTPARFELVRVGEAVPRAPLDPLALGAALARAAGFTEGAIRQFIGWSNAFAKRPNEVFPLPEELARAARGDPSTRYYNGYYRLGPEEALLIEFVPPKCEYWNFQLCNHWLESLDFMDYTTSVNQHGAVARPDGSVRLVVARRGPGVPNWLDTAGHARGCIAGRWVGADRDEQPRTRVVPLSALAAG